MRLAKGIRMAHKMIIAGALQRDLNEYLERLPYRLLIKLRGSLPHQSERQEWIIEKCVGYTDFYARIPPGRFYNG